MAFDFMAAIANVQDAVQEQNVDAIEAQIEDALDADWRKGSVLLFDETDSIEANMPEAAVVWRTPKEQRETVRIPNSEKISRNDAMGVGRGFRVQG